MATERYLSRRIPDLRVGNNIDGIDKKLIPASIHPCRKLALTTMVATSCDSSLFIFWHTFLTSFLILAYF